VTTTVLAYIPSPSQGVWHLGFVPIRAYALCIIAGIVAALVIGDRRWEARGGERGVIYDVALWAVPFGLIGGRLYHVMTDWQKYFGADGAGFLAALRIWDGGLGIWGAVALGGVGAWIACRRRGIPLPAFGDAIAPGIVLAQAIGRLGNYFNQELYGRETDLPWGLTIYDRLDPTGVVSPHSLDGVSTGQVYAVVHPTFLYELLWNVLIFALLIWADRRFKLGHGRLFALYVASYCVGRFWVELMRSDTATLIAGIRVNSFTSTFVFIGAVIYIMVAPKGREDPATLRGKDANETLVDNLGEELVAVAATSGVVAAAKVAGDEDRAEVAPHTESEAAAEAEDLAEQVATAPSEDIAEAEEFAAVGAAADEPQAGLGSVEGDEVEAAEGSGSVEGDEVEAAEEAEAVAEEVAADEPAAEEPVAESTEGLGSVEGDEVEAAEVAAHEVHEAAVEAAEEAEAVAEVTAEEPAAESTEGLGSVEGDEVEAAEVAAPEVHEAAVEAAEEAEAVAEVTAEEPVAESTEGLGSVEGDEVEAAEVAAPEVHEAAVEAAEDAEAVADEVAADEPVAEPTEGLGSVEGDEVEAAEEAAPEVHEAAVEAAVWAEAVADDVAADEPAAEPTEGLGSVEGDEAEAVADEVASEPDSAPDKPVTSAAPARTSRRRWWRRR
jgi:prolipoprotein diacylglyceryl transferase